jgi:hypothetical protein
VVPFRVQSMHACVRAYVLQDAKLTEAQYHPSARWWSCNCLEAQPWCSVVATQYALGSNTKMRFEPRCSAQAR